MQLREIRALVESTGDPAFAVDGLGLIVAWNSAAGAVASRETLRKIASEADETICLEVPARFYAVGQFFEDFSQVSDEQVVAIMLESSSRKRAVGE